MRRRGAQSGAGQTTGGIAAWLNETFSKLTRGRSRQTGAGYEATGASGGFGGRGPRRANLDPDEAWDSNVGNEAYYEEQELGLHAPTGYTGAGYGRPGVPSPGFEQSTTTHPSSNLNAPQQGERGRSTSGDRWTDNSRAEETGRRENPFGDEHATPSIHGAGPGPLNTSVGAGSREHPPDSSPTERRSMFREEM